MKKVYLIFIAIIFLFVSCRKDEKTKQGDISITAYTISGNSSLPLKGASVYTIPATKEGITDENGNVLLKGIDAGTYELYAKVLGFGLAKTVVRVRGDSLQNVRMKVAKGYGLEFVPEIEIISPSIPSEFSLHDKVAFSFNIKDNDSQAQDLKVVVSSSINGKIFESNPDFLNNVKFETSSLSGGTHQITVNVTDQDNFTSTKTFAVYIFFAPGKIVLDSAIYREGNVLLKWLKYSLDDFDRYEIYRAADMNAAGQAIATLNSLDSLSYIDKTCPFVSEIYYYVRIVNKNGQFRISNKIKVSYPSGKMYSYTIDDAVHHPSKPILYLLDRTTQTLRVYNYETNTEINSTSLKPVAGKIAIGDNGFGLEIYVSCDKGNIYVYDANTLNLNTTIHTGADTYDIATNGHGYIVATVGSYYSPIKTYSRNTGMNLGSDGNTNYDAVKFVPNTDNIITESAMAINMYELSNDGQYKSPQIHSPNDGDIHDTRIFQVSSNGLFMVADKYGRVYKLPSREYKGLFGRSDIEFSDFAFGIDGNTIYAGTSNKKSILFVNYSTLSSYDEKITKGYPQYLFYYKGNIISISRTVLMTKNFGFEKIKAE